MAKKKAKKKRPKDPPQDGGLSPKQRLQLRGAIRQVWAWSFARKRCISRATDAQGFARCEACGELVAKVYADHIVPCGEVDAGFIDRVFCPSTELQALCSKCHNRKTAEERRGLRKKNLLA